MDWVLVGALCLAVVGVAALLTVFKGQTRKDVAPGDEPEVEVAPSGLSRQARRRAEREARRRKKRDAGGDGPGGATDGGDGDDGGLPRAGGGDGPVVGRNRRGAKYEAKQRMKEARRKAREAQAAEEARAAEADELLVGDEGDDEAAAEAARVEAETERAAVEAAERAAAEAAAYEAMKAEFEVVTEGSLLADLGAEGEDVNTAFCKYVKRQKVVELDALASKFHLRTPEVVARLRALEADGRLMGIFDDRGKYIYVTMSELKAVARQINGAGRIGLDELAVVAGSLISVEKAKRKKRRKRKDEAGPSAT
ncbi:uncharacterized protein AMSG_09025 [Thecamonas trahens ATCC 50062]|uniref:DDRGK domain-containing protein 1 n=1 Tax=Thecamonas trahens ATCC 50062 TaxID=461836 RepID=A0A0L0DKW0_THETB|nr:hypothetical protein AMSG_09025 [Thecamonas trahens ATCC 50062]KNC52870.1 hypothetical protein AMSG_09025 [Thecamonas trahens ATCC 50062]|eukprot:XP_013754969.1 hypothetical protein AMSG_09025 [Thecamonas trahens ATCC 50062]